MTTIRQIRRPRPAASDPSRLSGPSASPPVRLSLLRRVQGERTRLDGAWWPRSRSLASELPALITELHAQGVRVSRVTYHPESWDSAPRRLEADGHVVRLGWFRSLDPNQLNLSVGDDGRHRLDLLVVPPATAEGAAGRAMSAATTRENSGTPTAVLRDVHALARVPAAAPVAAPLGADEGAEVWDSEGGHRPR